MGFLERLRQERHAKALRQQQIEERQTGIIATSAEAQRQLEARERELHAQRKQRAEALREQAGFVPVLKELESIISDIDYDLNKINWAVHWDGEKFNDPMDTRTLAIETSKLRSSFSGHDPDSVFDFVEWDRQYWNKKIVRNSSYYIVREKYLVMETCPDGVIVVHGGFGGSTTIPEAKWRNDKKTFESALERAYKHPRTHKFLQYLTSWSII